jgi:hypothetical protein
LDRAVPQLLGRWIASAAARDPDKAFIVSADDGRILTYGQLRALSARMATWLRGQGTRANDRVALLSNNSIEHLAAYFAVLGYGATICTVQRGINFGGAAVIVGGFAGDYAGGSFDTGTGPIDQPACRSFRQERKATPQRSGSRS